jgi:hypothetical protein
LNDNKKKVEISHGEGSWLESLEFDGKKIWTISEEYDRYEIPTDLSMILSSDSNNRPDVVSLKVKDYDTAHAEKDKIENIQRTDKKLRQIADKKRSKN